MKTGRPLPEVLMDLRRQQEAKRDRIAPAQVCRLQDDGQRFEVKDIAMDTTPLFHRQLASVLDIPFRYYERMQAERPELLAENVNSWLGTRDNRYMIRALDYGQGETARAFLSDRYRRIDNLEVAEAVLPLFAGREGIEVVSCEATETRMYIKIVNHRMEKAVVGDQVQAGVVITNSELGLGAVSVRPLLYTLACLNGMVVNSMGERQTHLGRTSKGVDENFAVYTDETVEAENKAFMLKLRDTALAAFDEARFTQILGILEKSAKVELTDRVQDVVEMTGKTYGLSQDEQDGVLNYLIRGGDLSLYGLANAITRTAQDVESYDRATALETIGWDVVADGKALSGY